MGEKIRGIFLILFLIFSGSILSYAQEKRDPFQSFLPGDGNMDAAEVIASKTDQNAPKLDLQGILWNPNRPTVLIANTIYRIGDKVKNVVATIVRVEKKSIVIESNGKLYKFFLSRKKEE